MNAVNDGDLLGRFSRILRWLGENDPFFVVSEALSRSEPLELRGENDEELYVIDSGQLTERIASFLTEAKNAWLAELLVKLGDNDDLTEKVRRLALQPDDNLTRAVDFLAANGDVAGFLTDAGAQQIVKQMATNGLYRAAQKLGHAPLLTERLADDTTPFFATLQILAAHPEMDGLLAAILRLLANDPGIHFLPNDDDFARMVLDLAESQAVLEPARRTQFFDLARGIADEAESQKIARKILFTASFPEVAARLAEDDALTSLVRRMLDDDHHKKVAEMLTSGGDSAQVILSVAEDPEIAAVVKRMCEDKAHPEGFNELIKKLRDNENKYFEQIKTLSDDELLREIHTALPDGPLAAEKLAMRFSLLGKRLHEDGKFDRAIISYKLALLLDPTLREAYLGHAQSCIAKEFYTMAVEDYHTLIVKNENDIAAYLGRGTVLTTLALYDDAEADFHKVLDLSIDDNERQQAGDGLYQIAKRKKP